MPRPNPARSIQSELNLARRIKLEREQRDWSLEGLAARMTSAGCAMQGSAIFKIESSDPPRRITVDELVAFGLVFGKPVEELLLPVEVVHKREALRLVKTFDAAWNDLHSAAVEVHAWWSNFVRVTADNPDLFHAFAERTVPDALADFEREKDPIETAVNELGGVLAAAAQAEYLKQSTPAPAPKRRPRKANS